MSFVSRRQKVIMRARPRSESVWFISCVAWFKCILSCLLAAVCKAADPQLDAAPFTTLSY